MRSPVARPSTSTVCSAPFTFDPPRIWAGGPTSGRHGGADGFGRFHRLTPLDELAWRMRIEGSQGLARAGVQRTGGRPPAALPRRAGRARATTSASSDPRSRTSGCAADARLRRRCSTSTAARGCTGRRSTAATATGRLGGHRVPRRRPARGFTDARGGRARDRRRRDRRVGPGGRHGRRRAHRGRLVGGHRREGPQPPARPRRPDQAGRRLLQRRAQVHLPALPRSRSPGRAAHLPHRRVRRRAHRTSGEVNSIPTTVGGGGTHADGKVPRFREEDFAPAVGATGPSADAEVADWPLAYDELEPFYAEVERLIGVAGEAGANPFAGLAVGSLPDAAGRADVRGDAVDRGGRAPRAAPLRRAHRGQLASPTTGAPRATTAASARSSAAPSTPRATRWRHADPGHGDAAGPSCWSETFVSRVIVERSPGDRGRAGRRPTAAVAVLDARHVVVAAGAVETPRLLLLSGIDHALIGRHLMVHFQTIAVGTMPRAPPRHRGRAVTHVHDDMIVGRRRDQGRGGRGRAAVDPRRAGRARRAHPAGDGGQALPLGAAPQAAHARLADPRPPVGLHHAGRGPSLARPTGSTSTRTVRDARGFPVARVTYRPARHELVASAHYGPRLVAMLEEMGATWTIATTSPGPGEHGKHSRRRPPEPSRHGHRPAWAPTPRTSVVDPTGRVHGARQRGGRRLLGLRDLGGLRAHAHPGRTRRPRRAPHALSPRAQASPRVSRRAPAIGPPPLATAATSGSEPPRRSTWRAPPCPRSWTHASWIRPKPWSRPPESWPPRC